MNTCAVVLAGGEGKRMLSDMPKPLSMVLEKPMLLWVIGSLKNADVNKICLVKGYKKEFIDDFISSLPFKVSTVYQAERLGTGHAVMQAEEFLKDNKGSVVILNGDAPFMDTETIKSSYEYHKSQNCSATVISAKVSDPTGYGRIVRDEKGNVKAIIEQKDADENILKINEVNSGGFWFETDDLLSVLDKITSNNKSKEYYLPDALKHLLEQGKKVGAFTAKSSDTVLGANDPTQLEELNQIAREKGYKCTLEI